MKTTILIIDFINDIVNEESKFANSAKAVKDKNVIENANKLIAFGRKNDIPLLFVKVGFSSSYVECPVGVETSLLSKAKEFGAYQLDSWGTEFHPKLDFQKGDIVITKHRVNAFYETDLALLLKTLKTDHLVICGVSTSLTVQTTARESHDRDFNTTIIQDACADSCSEEAQKYTFELLSEIANIKTTEEFIS
ncbi:cysteine hydrolase family protein [Aureivirga sp. CE67]|uniref:cysteine hydrolase family protein n=1 Tax=Aureivirga sp. CE67 TaxID=1788983 RepID=UPI0018CBA8F9|nr:isochorismatase family cysteine hydrolase [Aureivirga sp. CE67]